MILSKLRYLGQLAGYSLRQFSGTFAPVGMAIIHAIEPVLKTNHSPKSLVAMSIATASNIRTYTLVIPYLGAPTYGITTAYIRKYKRQKNDFRNQIVTNSNIYQHGFTIQRGGKTKPADKREEMVRNAPAHGQEDAQGPERGHRLGVVALGGRRAERHRQPHRPATKVADGGRQREARRLRHLPPLVLQHRGGYQGRGDG